jgi:hypothetical protein
MKTMKLKNTLMLLAVLFLAASCTQKEPVEEVNDMLDGKWEATSFKTSDNIERMTGDITRNSILFQKDSIHTGLMSLDIVTSLVTLEGWSGPYTLENDGNRLIFADKEFSISFPENDQLNMTLIDADEPFDIEAQRVE